MNNTNQLPTELVDHNDTFLDRRGRARPHSADGVPGRRGRRRATGYKPGVNHGSFAIEKRAGGHTFQLNFSNAFGTTMGQIARGGPDGRRLVPGIQHLAQVLLG